MSRFVLMPYPGSRRPFLAVLLALLAMWTILALAAYTMLQDG